MTETPVEWARELEVSFRPYADFVTQISEGLASLNEILDSIPESVSESLAPEAPVLESALAAPASKRKTQKVLPEKRVLLAVESELSRVLFSRYLKGLPLQLEYAKTQTEIESRMAQSQFDLILVRNELNEFAMPKAGLLGHTTVLTFDQAAFSKTTVVETLSLALWSE